MHSVATAFFRLLVPSSGSCGVMAGDGTFPFRLETNLFGLGSVDDLWNPDWSLMALRPTFGEVFSSLTHPAQPTRWGILTAADRTRKLCSQGEPPSHLGSS